MSKLENFLIVCMTLVVVTFLFRQFPHVKKKPDRETVQYVEPFFPPTLRHFKSCKEHPRCQPLDALSINQKDAEYVQERLRRAWGKFRPSVDLYVRTGCQTAGWVMWMLQSAEIFFPNFLGKIIVVLDRGDEHTTQLLQAWETKHSLIIRYEDTPCLVPRVFNQISYLNAYKWSEAEYIVTIDSDCVFFTPVTPYVLFTPDHKVIVPTSSVFQRGLWNNLGKVFTTKEMVPPGHSMVSQPVTFRRDTLENFWNWTEKQHGKSFYEVVDTGVDFIKDMSTFCWMCYVSTYVWHAERDKYDIRQMHATREPYRRFALHWKYENLNMPTGKPQVIAAIQGGLCIHFPEKFHCGTRERQYVTHYKFRYTQNHELCVNCKQQDYSRSDVQMKKSLLSV